MNREASTALSPGEQTLLPWADSLSDLVVLGGEPDHPRLLGSACQDCGSRFFPERLVCFKCMGVNVMPELLNERGTLYAVTTVHVSSSRETPYTIGFIDLDGGVRVLADLAEDSSIQMDGRVRLETDDRGWRFVADQPAASDEEEAR